MNGAIKGIPEVGVGSTANNRLARLERAVNRILKFIGNMEDGFGIQFKPTNDMSSIRISAEGTGGGGGSVDNMAWTATLGTNGDGDPVVNHLGGTVTFFGGAGTTFETAEYEIEEVGGEWQDAYCYLFWDASHNNGAGRWTREIEDAYPVEADMDDGDVFIPLWSLVDGALTQETVGAVVIPAIKNYVDADTTGEFPQPAAQGGGE